MFCLRSWIPILFFLYSRASPVYVLLFLAATYFLNRPCVYCSLLLAVLVIALFDFRTDWFESPGTPSAAPQCSNGTDQASTLKNGAAEAVSILATSFNSTAAALVDAAADQVSQRTSTRSGWFSLPVVWIQKVIREGELRIDCINTVIRL